MIIFRRAEQKDKNDFLEMERLFYEFYYTLGFNRHLKPAPYNEIAPAFFENQFEELMSTSDSFFLLAENDGEIIGYIFSEIADIYDKEAYSIKRAGHINSIFVMKEWRGSGIGKKLIEKTIEWLKSENITMCTLGVLAENESAISLYKEFGFETSNLKMFKEI